MSDIEPKTITVKTAAAFLGVSLSTAYEGCRAGTIPAIRMGKRWVIPYARFVAWLGEPAPENKTPSYQENRAIDEEDEW
jgi:excisionase family DNA binding protein